MYRMIGIGLVCVAALGLVSSASAGRSALPGSETTYLIMDKDDGGIPAGPHPALLFEDTGAFWPGPIAGTVWWHRVGDHTLEFALYGGTPGTQQADRVPRPGPDWAPATIWYLRRADSTTVLLTATARGNVWDHAATALPTTWDASTARLMVTLP